MKGKSELRFHGYRSKKCVMVKEKEREIEWMVNQNRQNYVTG